MKEKKELIEMYQKLLKEQKDEDTIENGTWNIEYLKSLEV